MGIDQHQKRLEHGHGVDPAPGIAGGLDIHNNTQQCFRSNATLPMHTHTYIYMLWVLWP